MGKANPYGENTAVFFRFREANKYYRIANQIGIAFVRTLIILVTLVVVAIPEGLRLSVTLALAFATKQMTCKRLLARVLGSCKTVADASVVCADKTVILTQNDTSVVAGFIRIYGLGKFVQRLKENVEDECWGRSR